MSRDHLSRPPWSLAGVIISAIMSTQQHETAQLKKAPNQLRPKMKAFIAAYRETGNITRAALMAKVSRRRHYGLVGAGRSLPRSL